MSSRRNSHFSFDAISNSELPHLLVEAAADQLYPASKALFLWGMVNKQLSALSKVKVEKKVDKWNQMYAEWRLAVLNCQRHHLRRHRGEDGSGSLLIAKEKSTKARLLECLQKTVYDLMATRTIDFIQGGHDSWTRNGNNDIGDYSVYEEETEFEFNLNSCQLAALCFQNCMGCFNQRCIIKTIPGWCSVGSVKLFGNTTCVQDLCVKVNANPNNRLRWHDERYSHYRSTTDRKQHEAAVLARCMLSQKGHHSVALTPYFLSAEDTSPGDFLRPSNPIEIYRNGYRELHSTVLLLKHPYIPDHYSLEGILQLSKSQMEDAIEEQKAILKMVNNEWEAMRRERMDKFLNDVGIRLQRRLNPGGTDFMIGKSKETREERLQSQLNTVYQLHQSGAINGYTRERSEQHLRTADWERRCHVEKRFPSLCLTIERLVNLHDPYLQIKDAQKYVGAMSIPEVAVAVERVVWATDELGKLDKHLTGGASNYAYEWCTQLFGGVMEGPTGRWRAWLDRPRKDQFPFCQQRPKLPYIVAAVHVFDFLAHNHPHQWKIKHSIHNESVRWTLETETLPVKISGPNQTNQTQYLTGMDRLNMHQMLCDAFKELLPDCETPSSLELIPPGAHQTNYIHEMSWYEKIAMLHKMKL